MIPGNLSGQLKPDFVIPFKLDKNAAKEALKKYYSKKRLLPKGFLTANQIEEIKGIYAPFWLFDGETEADMRFRATKVRTYTSGSYRVTKTDHYRVTRQGSISFEKVPVDGSSKMPDAHMDAIEPYSYGELKPFSTAYLPGFLAEKYDEDAQMCSTRANKRINRSTELAFAATTAVYSTLTQEYSNIVLKKGDVKYALLPVWMLSIKWNGKNFLFAMNGQTGKLVGNLPIDKGRYWSWFARISLPIAAVLAVLLFVLL
ncbi:MAG: hypothetical protein FWG29_09555 [Treponema sp.]|nr:hypothetical protein [Treponema sp.]